MLSAGRLRHRITLQRKLKTQTESGKVTWRWETYASNVAAEVIPSSVREYVASDTEVGSISGRIVIRYRHDIDHNCRVLFRNTINDIVGVLADNDSGLEYLTLIIKSGVSDG